MFIRRNCSVRSKVPLTSSKVAVVKEVIHWNRIFDGPRGRVGGYWDSFVGSLKTLWVPGSQSTLLPAALPDPMIDGKAGGGPTFGAKYAC